MYLLIYVFTYVNTVKDYWSGDAVPPVSLDTIETTQ